VEQGGTEIENSTFQIYGDIKNQSFALLAGRQNTDLRIPSATILLK